MYDKMSAQRMFIAHEGMKLKVYKDKKGNDTVGVGRLLRDGISKAEALFMLDNDIQEAEGYCVSLIPGYRQLSEARQLALLDMMFQMGPDRLLGFHDMLDAVAKQDWQRAHDECLDSDYARDDAPARAAEIAAMLLTGESKWVE